MSCDVLFSPDRGLFGLRHILSGAVYVNPKAELGQSFRKLRKAKDAFHSPASGQKHTDLEQVLPTAVKGNQLWGCLGPQLPVFRTRRQNTPFIQTPSLYG